MWRCEQNAGCFAALKDEGEKRATATATATATANTGVSPLRRQRTPPAVEMTEFGRLGDAGLGVEGGVAEVADHGEDEFFDVLGLDAGLVEELGGAEAEHGAFLL